jgi:hypothetical protein
MAHMKFASVVAALTAVAVIGAVPASVSKGVLRPVAPSQQQLSGLHDQLQTWLVNHHFAGFRVSELMAFTKNDYAAVNDKHGTPAFELLTWPALGWVMEEPASMMWNTHYGMVGKLGASATGLFGPMGMMGSGMSSGAGNWYGDGAGNVSSVVQAAKVANAWLSEFRAGETAEMNGRAFPGYFTLDTTRNGKTVGMLSVNASTGAVWYHGWHGVFLAERGF